MQLTINCMVIFGSVLAILDPRVGHTMDELSPFIFVLCHSDWLPREVHVLMLSIQAMRGLSHLRAPGIVPCIISFSLVSSWYDHSMLASLLWQCLTVPSLLQLCWEPTHLFSLLSMKPAESHSLHLKVVILSESPAFTAVRFYRPH